MRKWWACTTTCRWLLWLGLAAMPALAGQEQDVPARHYWRYLQLWPAHDLVSLKPGSAPEAIYQGRFPRLLVAFPGRFHFVTLDPLHDLNQQAAPHGEALLSAVWTDKDGLSPALAGTRVPDKPVPDRQWERAAVALAVSHTRHGIVARAVSGWIALPGSVNQDREFRPHHWVEYWHKTAGWQRLDPALAVLPSQAGERPSWPALSGYFPRLLADRGWMLLVAFLMFMCGLWRYQKGKPAERNPRAAWLYLAFCRRMKQRGLARSAGETPSAYYRRLKESHPTFAPGLHAVTAAYLRAAYGLHFTRRQRQARNRILYAAIKALDWRQLPQAAEPVLPGRPATDAG